MITFDHFNDLSIQSTRGFEGSQEDGGGDDGDMIRYNGVQRDDIQGDGVQEDGVQRSTDHSNGQVDGNLEQSESRDEPDDLDDDSYNDGTYLGYPGYLGTQLKMTGIRIWKMAVWTTILQTTTIVDQTIYLGRWWLLQ